MIFGKRVFIHVHYHLLFQKEEQELMLLKGSLDGPQGMNGREHQGFYEREKFKVGVSLKENSKS